MASVLIPKKLSRAFSSDPAAGALNVHNKGSSFSVSLNNPISIPVGAMDCSVDVIQANIWYVTPNISAVTNPGSYQITIPDGLYSLDDLNATLSREFANLGFAANIILLSPDGPTSKSIITYTIRPGCRLYTGQHYPHGPRF